MKAPAKPLVGVLTVISPELDAAQAALGILDTGRHKDEATGTVFWHGTMRSTLRNSDYGVVLACIGGAGNPAAAVAAAELVMKFQPKVVLLVGIAAGMKGKVRIGDVVLSERVVAYEPAALVQNKNGSRTEQRRPEIDRVAHTIQQDVVNYKIDVKRIDAAFRRIGGTFPDAPRGKKKDWKAHVAAEIRVANGVTIASGEKLLRDPDKLRDIRRDIHGKVEAGEMEAAGLVEACRRHNVPWLVIRGISDFGDDFKDDRFHALASKTAAAAMVDFLAYGLDLGQGSVGVTSGATVDARSNPFQLLPIDRDQDFFGREDEKGRILHAIDKGLPVQILGGAKVGKTSMLRWVERHVQKAYPLVRLDAGQALSPVGFIRAVAEKLAHREIMDQLKGSATTADHAVGLLAQLVPLVLLIDEGDKLATAGQGFAENFFEPIRGLVENRKLVWVSASRSNLAKLFDDKGLGSRFLTSTEKVWLGPLDRESSQKLAERARPEHVQDMMREAAGFAHGLQWLGDHLLREDGDSEDVYDAFALEMAGIFQQWWEMLTVEERRLVKECLAVPVVVRKVDADVRLRLNDLVARKILVKQDGCYRLIGGETWRSFVRHA